MHVVVHLCGSLKWQHLHMEWTYWHIYMISVLCIMFKLLTCDLHVYGSRRRGAIFSTSAPASKCMTDSNQMHHGIASGQLSTLQTATVALIKKIWMNNASKQTQSKTNSRKFLSSSDPLVTMGITKHTKENSCNLHTPKTSLFWCQSPILDFSHVKCLLGLVHS